MNAIRKILVAVKNPDARRHPAIDKAIHIAKTLGASVEFFHAIAEPVFLEIPTLTGQSISELKREALAHRQKRLDKLVARARELGVEASGEVEWDFPVHEAIVRRAVRCRAGLIVAECHQGRRTAPWLVHLTDWELLRTSPMPVLLLKNAKPWGRAPVLAAVDPSHAHAKPSGLDAEIVTQAGRLASATRAALHLVHANYPPFVGVSVGEPDMEGSLLAAYYERQKKQDRKDFSDFATEASISSSRRHLFSGAPVEAIPEAAHTLRASVVVMGAVSRSGLKRVFIGNTAERVLNRLSCDVLVVKPAHFTKRVSGKSRGMRMIAPQPLVPMPV